ncbi:MAG: YihA family ribosome biogenesis GTP-binding protein [Lautropia sp.]|nr:MAG: YihA family ribosome biogenesis GTP-binding protein [Pseudomonadota bacterium]MBC6959001.1 YihA family ribosome biogenesis GTP-binding protein [Lautropia sp.]MDL1906263.1 YihA family ribosome biogenesis GTP-binding protein [Betaproteobacteria bacterium PRO1]RIK90296.1 MAG: YihA family ribosome biogenesis GTP-binding protein [Burkholderiales bacterium]
MTIVASDSRARARFAAVASTLLTARFATTVAKLAQLPEEGRVPEVAFVGRSNAGKSSAINALCRKRRLAFASKTPGRTQALNYFALGPAGMPPEAYLVDTPGYGYATAPLEVKRAWDQLAGRYLSQRRELAGVVLVLDIRRGLTELDRGLLAWMRPEVPLLVLLTKADKLGQAGQAAAMREAEAALREMGMSNPVALISFSATRRIGLDETREFIGTWLSGHRGTGDAADAP